MFDDDELTMICKVLMNLIIMILLNLSMNHEELVIKHMLGTRVRMPVANDTPPRQEAWGPAGLGYELISPRGTG